MLPGIYRLLDIIIFEQIMQRSAAQYLRINSWTVMWWANIMLELKVRCRVSRIKILRPFAIGEKFETWQQIQATFENTFTSKGNDFVLPLIGAVVWTLQCMAMYSLAATYWWVTAFFKESCKTFQNVTIFWYLTEKFLENQAILFCFDIVISSK